MSRRTIANVITFGVIAVLGFASYLLLKPMIHQAPGAPAIPGGDQLRLTGTIHDFWSSHPDFDVTPANGYGHYAGNVGGVLGPADVPVFTGASGAPAPEPPGTIGYETAYAQQQDHLKDEQIATRVTLPIDASVVSITGYVGMKDKDVRFAVYADDDGEPGSLIAETAEEESAKDEMTWMTLGVPPTPLSAGTYWLAMAFEDDKHEFAYEPSGGETRYVHHDAAGKGFLSSWGTSDEADDRRIAIYATIETDDSGPAPTGGFRVDAQWTDAQDNPIAPNLFNTGAGSSEPIDFDIIDDGVIPQEPYAVQITVLGAAIQTGASGYHRPVTMKVQVGSESFEPFGPFENAVTGNLNDIQTITGNANGTNPRVDVITQVFSPATPIWVTGRSWKLVNSSAPGTNPVNWEPKMTAATNDPDDAGQVHVLRNGDPVPEIDGLYEQASIAEYVDQYVNQSTGTMMLGVNEIIYLFEVGENGNSSTADFQDLVVVVTLAADPTDFGDPDELCGIPFADVAGSAGPLDNGGISSAQSFGQWFIDYMGTNLSRRHTITLVRNAFGVYEYLDDAFHPADGSLLGNEGQPHNRHFTYAIEATFQYDRCAGQFFEFEGADDAWLYVDRKLVMDLGGVVPGTEQYVSMDRLGLEDGQSYEVHFFYAQRQEIEADFNLRTNIALQTSGTPNVISGSYD